MAKHDQKRSDARRTAGEGVPPRSAVVPRIGAKKIRKVGEESGGPRGREKSKAKTATRSTSKKPK